MADTSILSDFGINILEEEIDDVIFQTNEFLCDATFTGSQGSFLVVISTYRLSLVKKYSISITYKIISRDRISRRDKNGTKLAEIIFCLIACLIQHFKYRCLLLQRYTFVPN